MNKKGYLDISFSWIFAIIVGIIIIGGAIYGVSKIGNSQGTLQSAQTGTELFTLLNPLETSIESGKSIMITLPTKTRIRNLCDEFTPLFGRQGLQTQELVKNEWTSGVPVYTKNKYLFSDSVIYDKEFYVLSKSFEFPFKVSNVLYLIPSEDVYCFIEPPREIEKDLSNLNQKNLLLEDCPENSINVCFQDSKNCNIEVNYLSGEVVKGEDEFYFETNELMYAAIFSDKEIYECNVKRLMMRAKELSNIYEDKALFISQRCDSPIKTEIGALQQEFESYENSSELSSIWSIVSKIDSRNTGRCELW